MTQYRLIGSAARAFSISALEPSIPTSVRYLVETWADDLVPLLGKLEVPTIVLSPGFNEEFMASPMNEQQVRGRFHGGWEAAVRDGANLDHRVVDDARFLIWEDQPRVVGSTLNELTKKRGSMSKRSK